jgi:hypothetical protein
MRAGKKEKNMLKLDKIELNAEFGEDIKIPDECNVQEDLIYEIYKTKCTKQDIKHNCTFCPKNFNVDILNSKILHKIWLNSVN